MQCFQDLIDRLLWALEIGHVETILETSLLQIYLSMLHIGHLDQVLHICRYPEFQSKRRLGFDPDHPAINDNRFQDCDRTEF